MKKWDVFNQCTCEYMTKDDDWLDYIPRKGIIELTFFKTCTKNCLEVPRTVCIKKALPRTTREAPKHNNHPKDVL